MKAPISGFAIWAVIAASAALGVFGWIWTTGPLAAVTAPLAVACEIWLSRLPLHIQRATGPFKAVVGGLLLMFCLGFDAVSAHRGLTALGEYQAAGYQGAVDRREAARSNVEAARKQLADAIEPMPVCACPETREGTAARNEQRREKYEPKIAAAEAALTKISVPHAPSAPLPEWAILFILGFVTLLKAAGFWILSPASAKVIQWRVTDSAKRSHERSPDPETIPPPALSPAQQMAARRWSKERKGPS